ncbi:interleukin-4 receptor subunit alpha-like [Neoarius graeffei]|uniref:interleukin-4 receptor subunit alpha-like n=1 Tax=Neoarius graeffei TaxID=443677 RepID=UPI00298CC1CD|nr:interleukin-4 receptor subunit alpha-like [Neoarius graeffei]
MFDLMPRLTCKGWTMAAFIIILQVIQFLSGFGFTESVEPLKCFNDYDTELKCSLFGYEAKSCSENKLNASLIMKNENRSFTCHFDEIPPGSCECTTEVKGFVVNELFILNVMKGDKIWYTQNTKTHDFIKPRRPIIKSVIQKPNGDFSVTLDTTYKNKAFCDSLAVELTYSIDGSSNKETRLLGEGQTTHEIVGSNLQPNSVYSLRARMKSTYPPNKTFSDYSDPYVFKTPQSLVNMLRIIIPILCVILLICVSSVYFWFNRIFKPWWDKIPTPRFSTDFVKQVPKLLSFQTDVLSVSLDPTANQVTKKTCVESSQGRGEARHCSDSLEKGVDSGSPSLIYSSSSYKSMDENSFENKLTSVSHEYENQQLNESSFLISNRLQIQSKSFFENPVPTMHLGKNFLEPYKNLGQKIQMDFEYSVLNGCTDSGNSKLSQIMPHNKDMPVVLAYESINHHDAFSSCSNPSLEEPLSTMKPQTLTSSVHDNILIPMEDEYQLL